MDSWDLMALDLEPRLPQILSSSDAARLVVLDLEAGESLADHEVHERAWIVVLDGNVEVAAADGSGAGGVGFMAEFAPTERHEVVAVSKSRVLLLLAPWPGDGHPGAMTLEDKREVRRRAAERAG